MGGSQQTGQQSGPEEGHQVGKIFGGNVEYHVLFCRVFNFNQTYVVDTLEHFGVTQFSEIEIQTVCGIFDSNAFESTESSRVACRGLYLMSSLINSSCLPNTRHFFKVKDDEVYISIISIMFRKMAG